MDALKKYEPIVGKEAVQEIYKDAERISGRSVLHINSAYQGGGIAEILNNLIPLMNYVGIDAGWRILHASPDFFLITKKFFNALQGESINLTQQKKRIYTETCKKFSVYTHIDHDAVIIHDTQPLPLIKFYKKKQPWIWRCHTDISKPNKEVFSYLHQFIRHYDEMIVLCKRFRKKNSVPQRVMWPSIDPLSQKNMDLPERVIEKQLSKAGIEQDKPFICQISRFDKWKDHEGVIEIFKRVRKRAPCRLVLMGNTAMDDPEGQAIYESILRKSSGNKDIIVINISNDTLVNALQRRAAVILQKSFKEGFGLTVSEALWKGTPVITSNVGGITEQIVHGKNGYLLDPYDLGGFVQPITKLLRDKKLRNRMGAYGREYVRERFLITRHLHDWVKVLSSILK